MANHASEDGFWFIEYLPNSEVLVAKLMLLTEISR